MNVPSSASLLVAELRALQAQRDRLLTRRAAASGNGTGCRHGATTAGVWPDAAAMSESDHEAELDAILDQIHTHACQLLLTSSEPTLEEVWCKALFLLEFSEPDGDLSVALARSMAADMVALFAQPSTDVGGNTAGVTVRVDSGTCFTEPAIHRQTG